MKIGLIIVAVLIVGGVLMIGGFFFDWFTAEPLGRLEARKELMSGEYRLESYNWFHDQYASIKALEGKIDVLIQQKELYEPGTKEYQMASTNVIASQALRMEAIALYNQNSQKDYTRAQWKDPDLPYLLPVTPYP